MLSRQASPSAPDIGSVLDPDATKVIAQCAEVSALAGQVDWAAVQSLLDALGDPHPFVRWQAGIALAETGMRLRRRVRLGSPTWTRQSSELTFTGLLIRLKQSLHDPDTRRRAATADALALWPHEAVVNLLLEALEGDDDPTVRVSIALALGKIRDKAALQALARAMSDPSIWVQRAAADALGMIGDPEAVPALENALRTAQPLSLLRSSVVAALGRLRTSRSRELLSQYAQDEDPAVRWQAARRLGEIGGTGALPALQRLLRDEQVIFGRSVAEVAAASIEAIGRRELGLISWVRKTFYNVRHRLEHGF